MAAKYSNQFSIIIGNRLRDTNHPYVLLSAISYQKACADLTTIGSLKLWLYLSHNQDGFKLNLSQKACEAWGLKKDSYYKAIDCLIEKGYLVPTGEKDEFIFKETPEIKYDF